MADAAQAMLREPLRLNIVIIGDGGCGKTCDLIAYCQGNFPNDYIPKVFETTVVDFDLDDQQLELVLTDTTRQEGFEHLRVLSYASADVILLCFAINSPASFINAQEMWAPELDGAAPTVPVILVGNKSDLRGDLSTIRALQEEGEKAVEASEAQAAANMMGAHSFMECSALKGEGLKEIFRAAAILSIERRSKMERDRKALQHEVGCCCPCVLQ